MVSSLVHVKIEHDEALQSKKDLLSLELELVKILKTIREYRAMRDRGLRLKNRLKRNASSGSIEIKKIQKLLPRVRLNSLKEETSDIKENIKKSGKNMQDVALENELEQIQEKLRELQR